VRSTAGSKDHAGVMFQVVGWAIKAENGSLPTRSSLSWDWAYSGAIYAGEGSGIGFPIRRRRRLFPDISCDELVDRPLMWITSSWVSYVNVFSSEYLNLYHRSQPFEREHYLPWFWPSLGATSTRPLVQGSQVLLRSVHRCSQPHDSLLRVEACGFISLHSRVQGSARSGDWTLHAANQTSSAWCPSLPLARVSLPSKERVHDLRARLRGFDPHRVTCHERWSLANARIAPLFGFTSKTSLATRLEYRASYFTEPTARPFVEAPRET